MGISVFLSYPTPHQKAQKVFIDQVAVYLTKQGLEPHTMGKSTYDMDAPLAGIRRLMIGCCGLLAVAFRRSHAQTLDVRAGADLDKVTSERKQDVWLTSSYSHIEPAMAFQFGLPILILKEKGVLAEGVLEVGVTGLYLPEFECSEIDAFDSSVWKNIVDQWIGRVRSAYETRARPPSLY